MIPFPYKIKGSTGRNNYFTMSKFREGTRMKNFVQNIEYLKVDCLLLTSDNHIDNRMKNNNIDGKRKDNCNNYPI